MGAMVTVTLMSCFTGKAHAAFDSSSSVYRQATTMVEQSGLQAQTRVSSLAYLASSVLFAARFSFLVVFLLLVHRFCLTCLYVSGGSSVRPYDPPCRQLSLCFCASITT